MNRNIWDVLYNAVTMIGVVVVVAVLLSNQLANIISDIVAGLVSALTVQEMQIIMWLILLIMLGNVGYHIAYLFMRGDKHAS